MFARKKPEPTKKRSHNLSQFGLTDIPEDFDPSLGFGGNDNDDESDLEAELADIAGGGGKILGHKSKPQILSENDLDKMITNSLKEYDSDDDDTEELENDTDLLGELKEIVGEDIEDETTKDTSLELEEGSEEKSELLLPTTDVNTIGVIKERIEMYKVAEANAKSAGEGAKIRRFSRGLKSLNELLQQANAGKVIKLEDIPPEVSIRPAEKTASVVPKDVPTDILNSTSVRRPPSPPNQSKESKTDEIEHTEISLPVNTLVQQMRTRQQEYKMAALHSKRSGDTSMALQFLKVVKQFDIVVKMCEDGQQVDLSDMPPPPDQFIEFMENLQAAAICNLPATDSTNLSEPKSDTTPLKTTNILEALELRLNKYKSVEESAKSEGIASKARRFGRIVKQYEDAIKAYKEGRPVPYDELPVPPGFGPLPVESDTTQSPIAKSASDPSNPSESQPISTPDPSSSTSTKNASTKPQQSNLTTRTSGNQQKNNLAEQQMKILLERQKEFKLAAIEAKKAGEIDQAKEYLKIFKGFDALLNAASSGLPVDLSTLPVPPSQKDNLEASFAIITTDECDPDIGISEIGVRIEEQLAKQLMMCKNTRDHHKAMGDIAGMNRFENLALTVQKDLDLVRYSKRNNLTLPKFHYEKRSFNIVHCNTDLTDNELEIIVVRGINYNVSNPKEVDTYVKIEFPLPNDESFKAKTSVVKDTGSPDYDQHFKVDIVRSNRQFQRIFKRHSVKFEVYSRGCSLYCYGLSCLLPVCCFRGFLRSDIYIGSANVKLQPLETKCDIHDTFDLLEGRKKVGGKLEIKIRVRNPILTKQMEHIDEKWLVIDT